MKIAYFLMYYPTKFRHVAHDEMIELIKRGHEIKVIAVWGSKEKLHSDPPFEVISLKQKIYWHNLLKLALKHGKEFFKHLKELSSHMGKIESLRFVSQYPKIKIEKYDRVHAHFASNNALKAYLIAKFYKIPFSCTSHHSEILFYPLKNLKEIILHSKPFITISEYNKRFLIETYNVPEEKVIVNYCGVRVDFFRRTTQKEPDIFTIISVAALKPIKGLDYLINACSLLSKKGIKFVARIAGEGIEYNNLKKQIKDMGLTDCVKLLGIKTTEELKTELENSSIFVLPSLSEGIPIALMEAMAMELPVIATNITGIPELIDDGVDGLLVEKGNSQALAEKIELLYHDKKLREKLAKNARKKVCEKFNLRKNVEKLEAILREHAR